MICVKFEALLIFNRLFHLFVNKFSGFDFLQTSPDQSSTSLSNGNVYIYKDEDDLDHCLYYLKGLSNVLRWSTDSTWATLSKSIISTDRAHVALHRISKYIFLINESILIRISW